MKRRNCLASRNLPVDCRRFPSVPKPTGRHFYRPPPTLESAASRGNQPRTGRTLTGNNESIDIGLQSELEGCVGRENLRPPAPGDEVAGQRHKCIVEPRTPSEVARVLAIANRAAISIIPRGSGSKLDWGAPPGKADVILSLRRLDRVLEHAAGDMTVTVEAGCPFDSLQLAVGEQGQRLALDPLWPSRATIGGILATGDSGALRWTYGAARDLVLGMTVALTDGSLARSGGKVVKNVAGYDLPKLMTGSFGTLAVITQATFRLHPLPETVHTLSFELSSANVIRPFVEAMNASALLSTGVQIQARHRAIQAEIRLEGLAASIDVKARRIAEAAITTGASRMTEESGDAPWLARERLFERSEEPFAVCKVSLLPTSFAALISWLNESAVAPARYRLVAQATGLALIRLEADIASLLLELLRQLRERIQMADGSLVVMRRSSSVPEVDFPTWPAPVDAALLMRRVKERFDPCGLLNPGRFAGGI